MNKNLKKYKYKQTSKLIYNYSTYEIAVMSRILSVKYKNKLIKQIN